MDNIKKIHWKRGMELTPTAFTDADNFHVFNNIITKRLCVPKVYGLIPEQDFDLQFTISGNQLCISKIKLSYIDMKGQLVQVFQDQAINVPINSSGTYFITISDVHDNCIEENGTPYIEQAFQIKPIEIREFSIDTAFPFMKVIYLDGILSPLDFIPPCYTINAYHRLHQLATESMQKLGQIVEIIEKEASSEILNHIGLIYIELNSTFPHIACSDFIMQLQKVAYILKTSRILEKQDDKLQEKIEPFIKYCYSHTHLYEYLHDALYLFEMAKNALKEKEPQPTHIKKKEPEEEEFTLML